MSEHVDIRLHPLPPVAVCTYVRPNGDRCAAVASWGGLCPAHKRKS